MILKRGPKPKIPVCHPNRKHEGLGLCRNCYNLDRYKTDLTYREKQKLKTRIETKRLKCIVYNNYGRRCNCCGELEEFFLTIDHINNDGNVRRYPEGTGCTFYRWIIRNKFPNDLQTLCWNCQQGKRFNGGICPHERSSEG